MRIMSIRWQKLLVSIAIWLIAEIGLTWIGLDDLADCGEYLFKPREVAVVLSPALQELPVTSLIVPRI